MLRLRENQSTRPLSRLDTGDHHAIGGGRHHVHRVRVCARPVDIVPLQLPLPQPRDGSSGAGSGDDGASREAALLPVLDGRQARVGEAGVRHLPGRFRARGDLRRGAGVPPLLPRGVRRRVEEEQRHLPAVQGRHGRDGVIGASVVRR